MGEKRITLKGKRMHGDTRGEEQRNIKKLQPL